MKSNYIIGGIIGLIIVVGVILFATAPEANAPSEIEETETTEETTEETTKETEEVKEETQPASTGSTPVGSNANGEEEVPVNTNTTNTTNNTNTTQETVVGPDRNLYEVVTYTENGFEPRVLVVSVGDEIFFWNRSDEMMWVSGDVVSCNDPERGTTFDSCGEIGIGNGWTYTFNEPGTYDYKDNNDWNQAGRIIVE